MRNDLVLAVAMLLLGSSMAACARGTEPGAGGAGGTTTTPTGTGADGGGGEGGAGGGAACGDGVVAGAEGCDDGNTKAGDGCDAACGVEKGFTCLGEPSDCVTRCDDGVIGGAEACDDGNQVSGDGCDAACQPEAGWSCTGEPSACVTPCGDGLVAGAEECDDGDLDPGDGCDAACKEEEGWSCGGAPSACVTTCGDGIVAGAETCDDGGVAPDDGCDAACGVEDGYVCTGEPSACATVCGDGILAGAEQCDDAGAAPGDGCSAACAVEAGFVCTGEPSACVTVCGDGITAGLEGCDDAGTTSGDGCSATCAVENGWSCSGAPSVCATVCGDGILAGAEQCDDGNQVFGDGCSDTCVPNTGEDCTQPLVMSQATSGGGAFTWSIPSGGVATADGQFACDPNTKGPDAVIAYTKTSSTVASGGKLLHVKVDTPSSTSVSQYLNVEVKGGACEAGQGTSLKCLWYKDNWDVYLDVPPGTYHVWVQKNSPANATFPFPEVYVLAEEVPAAAAEGEGCFAPYTTASSIYTPPSGSGQPHTWSIPPSINSFDMGATWGEPGSISCENTPPHGDIHGVDAVIQYNKQSENSVLKIDVQNLDPTITLSDLDVEVLTVCDPTSPAKVSRNCRANGDSFSITAPASAGPTYLWVASSATSEELNGALVQVTEIFPGPGESWPTAQTITGSGPVSATSTKRLDPPSCFPAVGNVHWFKYTLANDSLSLRANAAGALGVYDEGGQQILCVTDAASAAVGAFGELGKTYYIAIPSPSAITSLTVLDLPYGGVGSVVTDMGITFPVSANGEYGMAVNATEIFMNDGGSVFSFPKTGNATAVQHGVGEGLGAAYLGYDLVLAGGSLFGVDNIQTPVTANRLFRVFDGATWGPLPWDVAPSYPASSPSHAIATDGASLLLSTRRTSTNASFYSFSTAAPSTPTLLGTAPVWYVVGLAADNQFFYVSAVGAGGEGVYRINRSNMAAAPLKIATIDTDTLCGNIEVDSFTSPQYLYVRDALGDVHAVRNPASTSPVHMGIISSLGTDNDYAMTYDKAEGALYLYESETAANGRIVKLQ